MAFLKALILSIALYILPIQPAFLELELPFSAATVCIMQENLIWRGGGHFAGVPRLVASQVKTTQSCVSPDQGKRS